VIPPSPEATGKMTGASDNRAIFIDAHTHMDAYGVADLDRALAQTSDHRILTISNATDVPSYVRASRIAERCDWIIPTFGIHPWSAMAYADSLETLDPYIDQSPMLGEIGLDYYYVSNRESYPAQRKVLDYLLAAAREQEKVINIHTKGAEKDVLDLLERFEIRRAIVHWYSGPFDVFDELLSIGAYFTVGVEIAYSSHVKALARDIPIDRLLTETDNPSGITWYNGELGMPVQICSVLDTLASVLGMPSIRIAGIVRENFATLLQNDPWMSGICLEGANPVK